MDAAQPPRHHRFSLAFAEAMEAYCKRTSRRRVAAQIGVTLVTLDRYRAGWHPCLSGRCNHWPAQIHPDRFKWARVQTCYSRLPRPPKPPRRILGEQLGLGL